MTNVRTRTPCPNAPAPREEEFHLHHRSVKVMLDSGDAR